MTAMQVARCENAKLKTQLRLSVRHRFHARGLPQDASNDEWISLGGEPS